MADKIIDAFSDILKIWFVKTLLDRGASRVHLLI